MRSTLLPVLLLTTSFLHAQDCMVQEFPEYGRWSAIAAFPAGGVVGALNWDQGHGDLLVVRVDAQGEFIWRTLLTTTNPLVELSDPHLLARPDGGTLVYGVTNHVASPGAVSCLFFNLHMIALDASGNVEWARYYMYEDLAPDWWDMPLFAGVLSNGDAILGSPRADGISLTRIGADGVPVWTKRYDSALIPMTMDFTYSLTVGPDDAISVCGQMDNRPFILHVDGNGEPLWSHLLEGYGTATACTQAQNGDLLVAGNLPALVPNNNDSFVLRIGTDGTMQTLHAYTGVPFPLSIQELSDGDVVLTNELPFQLQNTVLRTAADGEIVAAWTAPPPSQFPLLGFIATTGHADTLILALFANNITSIMRAAGHDDLSCVFDPGTETMVEPAFPNSDPLTVAEDDVIKTWTMSLSEPPPVDQLDLVTTLSSTPARPGFITHLTTTVWNHAGAPSGPSTITMEADPQLVFQSAVPTPDQVNGTLLTWNNPEAFELFEARTFRASFLVPTPIPLGTVLTHTASVVQDSTEISLANNTATWEQVVTGSYDPNDKLVQPEGLYHIENDSILNYTIRFQNTGTDTAFTVVVRDTLSADLDVTTFRRGTSLHPYTYTLTGGGLLTFTFANILLPDSNTNEPLSHGLVSFSIKPHQPLLLGQEITNAADIYFDFNEPVRTPDAVVIVSDGTGIASSEEVVPLRVFPIPVKELLTVMLPEGVQAASAWVTLMDGRHVSLRASLATNSQLLFPVDDLASGLHVFTLMDRTGRLHTVRFVKE
jgi:uncharacterized repeat protein (TIGR01451 family)